MTQSYEKFFGLACIALGTLAAALISIPLSIKLVGHLTPLVVVPMACLGAILGFRRRASRAFFYACLLAILAISSLFLSAPEKLAL